MKLVGAIRSRHLTQPITPAKLPQQRCERWVRHVLDLTAWIKHCGGAPKGGPCIGPRGARSLHALDLVSVFAVAVLPLRWDSVASRRPGTSPPGRRRFSSPLVGILCAACPCICAGGPRDHGGVSVPRFASAGGMGIARSLVSSATSRASCSPRAIHRRSRNIAAANAAGCRAYGAC